MTGAILIPKNHRNFNLLLQDILVAVFLQAMGFVHRATPFMFPPKSVFWGEASSSSSEILGKKTRCTCTVYSMCRYQILCRSRAGFCGMVQIPPGKHALQAVNHADYTDLTQHELYRSYRSGIYLSSPADLDHVLWGHIIQIIQIICPSCVVCFSGTCAYNIMPGTRLHSWSVYHISCLV